MSKLKFIALVSVLALTAMACSLTQKVQQQAEEAVSTQVSNISDQTQGDNGTSADHPLLPQEAADIQSFRIRLTYDTNLENGTVVEAMRGEGEYLNGEEPAEHFVLTTNNPETGDPQSMEYIAIGGQVWLQYEGMWMSINSQEAAGMTMEDLLADINEIPDTANWEKIGKETVNGISVTHYQINDPAADFLTGMNAGMEEDGGITFTSVEEHVYLSDENIVIKRTLHAEGTMTQDDGSTQPVIMDFNFEIYDINADDIVITPPDSAASGLEAPFPLPENAASILSSPGFSVYNIPDMDLDTAVAFFAENPDFSINSKMGDSASGYVLIMNYQGSTYTLTLSPSETSGVDISILGSGE